MKLLILGQRKNNALEPALRLRNKSRNFISLKEPPPWIYWTSIMKSRRSFNQIQHVWRWNLSTTRERKEKANRGKTISRDIGQSASGQLLSISFAALPVNLSRKCGGSGLPCSLSWLSSASLYHLSSRSPTSNLPVSFIRTKTYAPTPYFPSPRITKNGNIADLCFLQYAFDRDWHRSHSDWRPPCHHRSPRPSRHPLSSINQCTGAGIYYQLARRHTS